jgi:phenylpropionate dioxygenase-like ring-hydroxylating dioxygenase large terminal subunit
METTNRQPGNSEQMTRVGPGTVMGELMRQYWLPALASKELVADGDPRRLVLLGEKLIAFRDSNGRAGIMDHRCPHRVASLFFGRNEQAGIRCVYHGWKFDVDGNCLDMPNVPACEGVMHKVRAKAYKTAERGGLVWVFMGDQTKIPPLPMLEAAMIPDGEANIRFVQRECNWLQALEGDIDTSHFGFLHAGSAQPEDFQDNHPCATRSRTAHPSTVSATRIGAPATGPTGKKATARCRGAWPTSRFRSGPRPRTRTS